MIVEPRRGEIKLISYWQGVVGSGNHHHQRVEIETYPECFTSITSIVIKPFRCEMRAMLLLRRRSHVVSGSAMQLSSDRKGLVNVYRRLAYGFQISQTFR